MTETRQDSSIIGIIKDIRLELTKPNVDAGQYIDSKTQQLLDEGRAAEAAKMIKFLIGIKALPTQEGDTSFWQKKQITLEIKAAIELIKQGDHFAEQYFNADSAEPQLTGATNEHAQQRAKENKEDNVRFCQQKARTRFNSARELLSGIRRWQVERIFICNDAEMQEVEQVDNLFLLVDQQFAALSKAGR